MKNKRKKALQRNKGLNETIELLKSIDHKHDGFAIVFDADTGDLRFANHGLCHHDIDKIVHDVIDKIKITDLKHAAKETEKELKHIERLKKTERELN